MTKSSMIHFAGAAIIFVICLVALPSCGGGEPDAGAEQPHVDPRFASADGLIEHHNELSSTNPIKAREVVGLFYAENRKQESMVRFARSMLEIAELDLLMRRRFNEGWDPTAQHAMLAPSQPARIVEHNDRRARAEYIDPEGRQQTLQLVQIGDRWWISGYTLEHDPELNRMIADWERFEHFSSHLGDAAQRAGIQLQRGDFDSAQAVRQFVVNEAVTAAGIDAGSARAP